MGANGRVGKKKWMDGSSVLTMYVIDWGCTISDR